MEFLLGVFSKHVEIFGVIVSCLLGIVVLLLVFVGKTVTRKVRDLDELHDDIIAVKLQDEGRRSFTNTLLELHYKSEAHEKRLDAIDTRCEARYKWDGKERRN